MKTINQDPEKVVFVQDIRLAAALATMGIPARAPNPIEKIVKEGELPICYFYFNDVTDKAKDYIQAWTCKEDFFDANRKDHPLNNELHPFWFIRAALRNRERFLDGVKEGKTIHMKTIRGKTFLITFHPNDDRRK